MATDINGFIERYQRIYEKDPDSKVFAPLAEAYRRMGLVDEAIDLASEGVRKHPNFASGRVALGKCYVQKGEFSRAVEELKMATSLAPENLLAHQLLADCFTKLKKPSEALNAFKMVLFLNPRDTKAAENVKALEEQLFTQPKMTWAEEDFSMEKLKDVAAKANEVGLSNKPAPHPSPDKMDWNLERELALLDSRFERSDWENVKKQLEELGKHYPFHPEVEKRKKRLTRDEFEEKPKELPKPVIQKNPKLDRLEKLLARFEKLAIQHS